MNINLLRTFILTVLLINITVYSAIAQKENNWLSVSIGTAIPFNDFSRKTLTDTTLRSGFAKTGFSANVAYTRQLSNNFGITAMFAGHSNNSNIDAMQQEWARIIKNAETEIGDFTASGEFGRWTTGMLVVGPNINFYLAHHFMMEIRGMIGLGLGMSPQYDYKLILNKSIGNVEEIHFKQQSDNAMAFAWNVGAGLKYRFSRLFIRLNLDYAGMNLKYNDVNIQFQNPFSTGETADYLDRNSRMQIQTNVMHVTGGIGWLF